jgi:O-antigen/teichoic acid export membrane protein
VGLGTRRDAGVSTGDPVEAERHLSDFAELQDTLRTGFHVAALRLCSAAVGFGSSIIVARALGPTGRGLYALPVAVVGIAFALSHIGLEHANVYLAARRVSLRRLWANATIVALGIGVASWAVFAVVYPVSRTNVLEGLPASWAVVSIAQLPFLLLTLYWMNVLQLDGRLALATGASFAGSILFAVVCGALWATGGLTPFRTLLAWCAMNGLVWALLLALSVRARLVGTGPDWGALRRGVAFGLKAYVGVMFFFLLLRIDQLLVQRILGFHELGIYSLSVALAEILWLLTDPFAASLLRHQVAAEGGGERRLGDAMARMSLLLSASVAVIAWIVAPYAVRIAYGAQFDAMVWPFRLLLPGVVALSTQRAVGAVLVKEGRVWLVSAFGACGLALNVVLNLVLLPSLGVPAASIATSVCYIGLALAYMAATRKPGQAAWGDLRPRPADVLHLWRGLPVHRR